MDLLLLLLIVVILERTDACLAMKPGTLPCPSVPQRIPPSNAEFEYSELSGPEIIDKAKVYKCKYGTLKLYDSPTALGPIDSLVCKPDTGHYWRRDAEGKEVYVQPSEEYYCQETACPTVSSIESTSTPTSPFAVADPLTSIKGVDSIKTACPEGSKLYDVSAAPPKLVAPSEAPFCTRNSGTWTPNTADYQCLTTPLDHIDACRDTCSTLYDDIMTIGQKQICPAGNSIIYVIRGVTDDGKCITLDNDSGRRMDYDQATRRWIYVDEEDGQKEYMLKAASCALGELCPPLSDSYAKSLIACRLTQLLTYHLLTCLFSYNTCPCAPLPLVPDKAGVPASGDLGRLCNDPNMGMLYTYIDGDGNYVPVDFATNPSANQEYQLRCMAGVYIMSSLIFSDWPGWVVDQATCFLP